MTLIVENGTGLQTAESYVSVADCDAYHTRMGNADWAGADAVKEAALRRASQYIDAMYTFRGEQLSFSQALAWPRYDIWIGNVYQQWPVQRVIAATCELALRALSNTLVVDATDTSVTEETVGPVTVKYSASLHEGQVRFSLVDKLLNPFVGGGGSRVRLDRA